MCTVAALRPVLGADRENNRVERCWSENKLIYYLYSPLHPQGNPLVNPEEGCACTLRANTGMSSLNCPPMSSSTCVSLGAFPLPTLSHPSWPAQRFLPLRSVGESGILLEGYPRPEQVSHSALPLPVLVSLRTAAADTGRGAWLSSLCDAIPCRGWTLHCVLLR